MSYITEIGKRKLELVEEAVDWLSYPVRISIDKGGEIHIVLSVRMGDPAHYSLRTRKPEDPVVEFAGMLVPNAESVSITFGSLNVIDEVKIESRDDCLVIHNKRGAPPSTSARSWKYWRLIKPQPPGLSEESFEIGWSRFASPAPAISGYSHRGRKPA